MKNKSTNENIGFTNADKEPTVFIPILMFYIPKVKDSSLIFRKPYLFILVSDSGSQSQMCDM